MVFFLLTAFMAVASCAAQVTVPQNAAFSLSIKNVGKRLSIAEAVDLAYKNRPSYQVFQHDIDINNLIKKQTLSDYLPQISLSKNFTTSFKGLKSNADNSLSIQGQQLIYSFANPFDAYAIAQKNVEIAQCALRGHKNEIRLEVESSFLTAWLTQEKYAQELARADSASLTFQRDAHRNKQGLLDKNEWLTSRAQYAQEGMRASAYKEEILNAYSDLKFKIGTTDTFGRLWWDAGDALVLKPLSFYVDHAVHKRSLLAAKRCEQEREEKQAAYTMNKYLPSVTAHTRFARDLIDQHRHQVYGEVGVSINWNLFDGFFSYYDAQVSKARSLRAAMDYQSSSLMVRNQVETAYYECKQVIKRLRAQHVVLLQAHNEFILQKQKHAVGEVTVVDVDKALLKLQQEIFNVKEQRVLAELSKCRLLYAASYPAEDMHDKKEIVWQGNFYRNVMAKIQKEN